jgi:Amidohydrolase family
VVRADFTPSVEEERAPRGESTDRQLQCGRYTQPAGTILRSPPRVLMMQASDHGHLDDSTLVGALHRSRLRCVLLQGEVSPATVVVGEVVSQQMTQVRFVQDHDVVEALAAQGPNEALFGTDVGYMTDYDPTDEYVFMSHAGLTFSQILAMLTTAPAERFGVAARVGRLAPGMDADGVVIDGQPERDVSALARVRYTFVRGPPRLREEVLSHARRGAVRVDAPSLRILVCRQPNGRERRLVLAYHGLLATRPCWRAAIDIAPSVIRNWKRRDDAASPSSPERSRRGRRAVLGGCGRGFPSRRAHSSSGQRPHPPRLSRRLAPTTLAGRGL